MPEEILDGLTPTAADRPPGSQHDIPLQEPEIIVTAVRLLLPGEH